MRRYGKRVARYNHAVTELRHLATLVGELEGRPARLDKLRLVAEWLRALPPDDVPPAVAFLTGRAAGRAAPADARRDRARLRRGARRARRADGARVQVRRRARPAP